jgi:hypothetical protein
MATGLIQNSGGVLAPADVVGGGQDAWSRVAGIPAYSAIVGGPGHPDDQWRMPYNVDRSRGRIVTNDAPDAAAGPGTGMLEDWKDILNVKHSPVPWLLLLSLLVLGLMQFRVMARVGKKGPRVSAALG